MAIASLTTDLFDRATGPSLESGLQTVIATPAALGGRDIQYLSILLGDQQASLTIQTALSSGTPLATTAGGYPKTMTALAMVLGSYDAARDFLAAP